uniref:DUF834 domain-containing protein n=1 Tax=Oryza meridionalis TaxID=40149 RepID=A0A0E0CFH3_9ORYZ
MARRLLCLPPWSAATRRCRVMQRWACKRWDLEEGGGAVGGDKERVAGGGDRRGGLQGGVQSPRVATTASAGEAIGGAQRGGPAASGAGAGGGDHGGGVDAIRRVQSREAATHGDQGADL